MKLLTHNFLACNIKGVKKGYPLKIEVTKVEEREADLDPAFIKSMMSRVDYSALKEAALAVGISDLPDTVTDEMLEDDEVIQKLHHALLEVHLEEGNLVCPETGRRFPVSRGIPNMLLNEDEV